MTSYAYDVDKIDVIAVYQRNPSGGTPDPDGRKFRLIAAYSYNAQHEPLVLFDAAGQPTVKSYNAYGQVLTVTNPKKRSRSTPMARPFPTAISPR